MGGTIIRIVATLAFASLATATLASELPRAKPETVGLSPERLGRITATLKQGVEEKRMPGAVLLIARNGKVAYFEAVGVRDPQTKAPMTRDSIFRIYSMTKPITSVAAMMQYEEGMLQLSDPVARFIPALGTGLKVGVEKAAGNGNELELVDQKRPMSVQDLLRHSSGLTYGFFGESLVKKAYREKGNLGGDYTNEGLVDRLGKLPLHYQPGSTWDYSYSTDVLGRVVEVVDKTTHYQSFKRRLLDPLGMKDTAFYVTDKAKQPRIAEPFPDDRTIGVGATIGDPRQVGPFESGGGGLTGTAMDYARFLQMLLNGGELDGKRYLSPRTIAYMTSDHMGSVVQPGPLYLPGAGHGFGLGFAVRKEAGVAPYAGSAGDYWWGGAGGTYFWVDPKERPFVVFMMQSPKSRVYYRPLLRDMVYAAIVK
jgi:CubicO group peptidase (beta-lactamase class C family)